MGLDSTYRDMLQFERWALTTCRQSEDYREGIRAFIEKRDAVFRGR